MKLRKTQASTPVEAAAAAAAAKLLQSCLTLCNPIDSSLPGFPVPGILQARTLEWVDISFSNAWKWKVKIESEVTQSCRTLRDSMDCSPPGFSVHGIFQARVLEWGAIAFSSGFVTSDFYYAEIRHFCTHFDESFFLSEIDIEFCQMLFLHLLRWSCNFYPSFYYCGVSLWLVCECWTIFMTLE